jgi:hypothetical protein
MKKILIPVCAAVLLLGACKKDNGSDASKTETLQKGKWKMTEAKLTFDLGEQDLYGSFDDCVKDNLYKFNTDMTITNDAGALKCDASEPQTTTDGSWMLTSGDKKIMITGSSITQGFGSMEADITQLDNNTFKVRKDTTFSSFNAVIHVTFVNAE